MSNGWLAIETARRGGMSATAPMMPTASRRAREVAARRKRSHQVVTRGSSSKAGLADGLAGGVFEKHQVVVLERQRGHPDDDIAEGAEDGAVAASEIADFGS